MNNIQRSKRGFTLVEIMIVVVIIGLLAAMAIPAFNKVRAQSRQKTVTNNLRQLAAAGQQYMLDKGVTQAAYTDLVGTATDNYIRSITPVADELPSYQAFTMAQGTTQVTISSPANSFDTVTYNL